MYLCQLSKSELSFDPLTVYMSHLPVRDVHLLVITRWKRKRDRVSSGKHPINVCLHHLQQRTDLVNLFNFYSGPEVCSTPCSQWWNPLSPSGCHFVSRSLLQEHFLQKQRHVSRCNMEEAGRITLFKAYFPLRDITCSDDTHICPQDFTTLQNNFL